MAKGFGLAASEYKEILQELHQMGLLTEEEARLMRDMAGHRNRLVYFYDEISTVELYKICARQASDIAHIADRLAQWIVDHLEQVDRSL